MTKYYLELKLSVFKQETAFYKFIPYIQFPFSVRFTMVDYCLLTAWLPAAVV